MHSKKQQKSLKQKEEKFKEKFGSRRAAPIYSPLPGFPTEYDTTVKWSGYMSSSGATNTISFVVATNSLLQGGSGVTLGLTTYVDQLAKAYASYRVTAYKIWLKAMPRSTSITQCSVVHLANDPAYSTGVTFDQSTGSLARSQFAIIPATTMTPNVLTLMPSGYSICTVVGSKMPETDINYAGTINSSGVFTAPNVSTVCVVYVGPTSGTFTASQAPQFEVRVKQYVRFFDKRDA